MKSVFDPIQLGKLTLKNRVAMAPMTRARSPHNVPTSDTARYYGQRAGAGLIVTEGTVISAEGAGFVDCPGLWSAEQVEAWKPVTQAAHDQGSAIFTPDLACWPCKPHLAPAGRHRPCQQHGAAGSQRFGFWYYRGWDARFC